MTSTNVRTKSGHEDNPYADMIAEALTHKQGLTPVLGGKGRRYQDSWRAAYAKYHRDVRLNGGPPSRFTAKRKH